jgi:hypothetical protein
MAKIVEMVEKIRALREQIADRNTRLASDPEAKDLVALGEQLISDLNAIEEKVHNPHAEVDYDILGGRHGGAMLHSRLSWLFTTAGDHDGPPTRGMEEVAADLGQELAAQEAALTALISGDLSTLNERAEEVGVPYVVAPGNDDR